MDLTLFVKYLTTGEAREDGTRTVFFELNGQPRAVNVADRTASATLKRHPKADAENADHLAAPMPGKVSSRDATIAEVHVEAGTVVEARDLLVVLKT